MTPEEFASINTLHELLAVGLRELRKWEQTPGVTVDMSFWLLRRNGQVCSVCLAGAVLAGFPCEAFCDEDEYKDAFISLTCCVDDRVDVRKNVLNKLRQGRVSDAGWPLKIDTTRVPDRRVTPYGLSPAQWHADMDKLLADLTAAGI